MGPQLLIRVSVGELLDRMTILELKIERIADLEKRSAASDELKSLKKLYVDKVSDKEILEPLLQKLRVINSKLWDLENEIRYLEKKQDFGEKFIDVSREICRNNDLRSQTKVEVNRITKSDLIEHKDYSGPSR